MYSVLLQTSSILDAREMFEDPLRYTWRQSSPAIRRQAILQDLNGKDKHPRPDIRKGIQRRLELSTGSMRTSIRISAVNLKYPDLN